MPSPDRPLIFDGHNDVLLKLYQAGGAKAAQLFLSGTDGALDVTKARQGGFGGGFFAVYVPSPMNRGSDFEAMTKSAYDIALPDPIPFDAALDVALEQVKTLFELERLGALKVCRSVSDIRDAQAGGRIAAIFHIEGAEAVDPDLRMLDLFFQAGLRSIGPVWSRPTVFGHGVPFRFPSDPNIGPGLSEPGLRLVARCNELGIMIDLSHLNEAGFWDVAKTSNAPLVATHSNAHAMTPHARNLTDAQLDAIAASDGMVGLNFAVAFLRDDGRMIAECPLEQVLRHLDYLLERLGEDRVGLGSDYDGAVVPPDIATVAELPNLRQAMVDHGYGADLINKLCQENWLRVLEKTWVPQQG